MSSDNLEEDNTRNQHFDAILESISALVNSNPPSYNEIELSDQNEKLEALKQHLLAAHRALNRKHWDLSNDHKTLQADYNDEQTAANGLRFIANNLEAELSREKELTKSQSEQLEKLKHVKFPYYWALILVLISFVFYLTFINTTQSNDDESCSAFINIKQDDNAFCSAQFEDFDKRHKVMETMAAGLTTAFEESKQVSFELTQTYDNLVKDHSQLTKTYDNLAKDHSQLTKIHNDLTKTHNDLAEDRSQLIKTHTDLIKDNFQLNKTHNDLVKDHSRLTKTYDTLIGDHFQLQNLVEDRQKAHTNLSDLTKAYNSLIGSYNDVTKRLDTMISNNDENKELSRRLREDLTRCLADGGGTGGTGDGGDDGGELPPPAPNQTELIMNHIITPCRNNVDWYDKNNHSESNQKIFVKLYSPQVQKEIHLWTYYHLSLLDLLYLKPGSTGVFEGQISPMRWPLGGEYGRIFNYFWKPLLDSGAIPQLSPNLKLFFSTTTIVNNEWIQFHGPGTELLDVDPDFQVTLGGLCGPHQSGGFYGLSSWTAGNGQWKGSWERSSYQISIKWE